MRMSTMILTVLAATLLVAPIRSQEGETPASKDQTDEQVKKVQELRKERIAVLKDLIAALDALYRSSRGPLDGVLEARQQLIDAELETAKTAANRVEIYKNLVAVLKQYEEVAEVQRQAGRGTSASVLKAKAARLEAEIHLEQAKMKVAKEGK